MKEKVKIAIIDNGVWLGHPELIEKGKIIKMESLVDEDGNHNCGHGTAIYHIISSSCPFAEIVNFKIANGDEIDEELLCVCLEYLAANYDFDVVNVSMGISICNNIERLRIACEQIRLRGGIVVSAFDNSGSISYPAAFECVIGVTNSKECHTKEEIVVYNDHIVNIGAKGGLQRVAWNMPPYIIASGNSFACAHVTAKVARIINSGIEGWAEILKKLQSISKYVEVQDAYVADNRCKMIIKKLFFFRLIKRCMLLSDMRICWISISLIFMILNIHHI